MKNKSPYSTEQEKELSSPMLSEFNLFSELNFVKNSSFLS